MARITREAQSAGLITVQVGAILAVALRSSRDAEMRNSRAASLPPGWNFSILQSKMPLSTPDIHASVLQYALFLCRGQSISASDEKTTTRPPMVVLNQAESPDFEQQLRSEAPTESDGGSAPLRIIILSPETGAFPDNQEETYQILEEHWDVCLTDVALLCSPLVSGYRSRTVNIKGRPCLEVGYNISETLSYMANNTSPLDSSPSVISSRGPTDMMLHHQYEPMYFRYDLTTGDALYILLDARGDLRHLIHGVGRGLQAQPDQCLCVDTKCKCKRSSMLHPFALQSAVLFYILSTRTMEIDNLIKWLLWIETQLHQGSLFEITGSEGFSRYIQLLHKMSRNLITLEHSNQRDAANIDHLLRDLTRLGRLGRSRNGWVKFDNHTHDRVQDDLLALRDFCDDRHRRIVNLRQRTNNFITLLYNLITGHDSSVNLRIATQSANIASETRKDSTSMKIIAAVTLLYLPPTFVCSLFGTNLVSLNTSNDSNQTNFVVSELWWLYLVFALPLTAMTMFGFLMWRRFRERRKLEA